MRLKWRGGWGSAGRPFTRKPRSSAPSGSVAARGLGFGSTRSGSSTQLAPRSASPISAESGNRRPPATRRRKGRSVDAAGLLPIREERRGESHGECGEEASAIDHTGKPRVRSEQVAPKATGEVLERRRDGSVVYALRFRAYGKRRYLTLGTKAEGWSHTRANEELQNVLADVRRGLWRPPVARFEATLEEDRTFHEFASEWFEAMRNEGLARNTLLDYEWQLTHHLLPFFARHSLSEITIAEVDRYRQLKVREGRLSATSINKTIARLAQILDVAVERELIDRNPARGKRRRLKQRKPVRTTLDRADQIEALISAAARARSRRAGRPTGDPAGRAPLDADLRRPPDRRGAFASLGRRRSCRRPDADPRREDRRRRPPDRPPPGPARGALGAQGGHPLPSLRRFRLSDRDRPSAERQQHSHSGPGAVARARERAARERAAWPRYRRA